MRLTFTLFSILLLNITTDAQKITGIWRGYFTSANGMYREGAREENYKYEIQIEQLSNNSVKGVTYSYKSTVFYGKAEIQGILTLPSKSLIIKETRLIDLKIGDKSEPCLMTCYLDYSKMGKLEVLEGTFISVNIKDKGDCGSGKVYLERVSQSDFKKEDFLVRKKQSDTPKNKWKEALPKPSWSNTHKTNPAVPSQQKTQARAVPKKNPPLVTKKETRSGTPKTNLSKKEDKNKPVERVAEEPVNSRKEAAMIPPQIAPGKVPIPRVLRERENNLVRTINTSEENIQVDLYDNGTIDNDTISVYHNNVLVIGNARLSYKAITVKIKCSKTDSHHEFVVVAENLGDIPPNTALMVVTAGKSERYEIFLASTEQRNAKVILNYTPKE